MNYLEEVASLAHCRFESNVDLRAWDQVEDDIGIRLPSDFKIVQECLGVGTFGENVCFRHRLGCDTYTSFNCVALAEWAGSISYVASLFDFSVFPTPGGLVPIGLTGTGINVVCYQNAAAEAELCLLDVDLEEIELIGKSFAKVLYETYHGYAVQPLSQGFGRIAWPPSVRTFFTSFPKGNEGMALR